MLFSQPKQTPLEHFQLAKVGPGSVHCAAMESTPIQISYFGFHFVGHLILCDDFQVLLELAVATPSRVAQHCYPLGEMDLKFETAEMKLVLLWDLW